MNIRVKNLASEVSTVDLQKLFAEYGRVGSISLVSDTGEPFGTRHIAFIEMPIREEGLSAIKALDGAKFKNIALAVTESTGQK